MLDLKLVIPLLMFFIPYELYLYGTFLMKKGCLPGSLCVSKAHAKERILVIFKINIIARQQALPSPPLWSTILTLLAEAGAKQG